MSGDLGAAYDDSYPDKRQAGSSAATVKQGFFWRFLAHLRKLGGARNPADDRDSDQGAIERLRFLGDAYSRHSAAVYGAACEVCGKLAAEKVTIEVFNDLWSRPVDVPSDDPTLRSSLVASAHRLAICDLKSDAHRTIRLATMSATEMEQESLDRVCGQVAALLAKLPASERRTIVLAFFGGKDYREIAALLGESEDTIMADLRSGLRRLKRQRPADTTALPQSEFGIEAGGDHLHSEVRPNDGSKMRLQETLESRAVIEQAKGIIAEHNQIGVDEALSMLRVFARTHNRPLADTCREIIDGTLEAQTLVPAEQTVQPPRQTPEGRTVT